MNPTTEGCAAMARNSKVSAPETLIHRTRGTLVAFLVLFLFVSLVAGEASLMAQDPAAGAQDPAAGAQDPAAGATDPAAGAQDPAAGPAAGAPGAAESTGDDDEDADSDERDGDGTAEDSSDAEIYRMDGGQVPGAEFVALHPAYHR